MYTLTYIRIATTHEKPWAKTLKEKRGLYEAVWRKKSKAINHVISLYLKTKISNRKGNSYS